MLVLNPFKTLISLIGLAAAGPFLSAEVDFARDIRPILNANCTECHGGVKAAGKVSFVYENRVVNYVGKSDFTVVTPGNLEESELYYRITTDDEEERMPPVDDHEALSEDEIALIKQWIEEGAKWSGHWAFETPQKSPLPETNFDDRAKSDLDRFIFDRLEKEGLAPSQSEAPGRFLRRLSLGLIGLPPSVDELDAFEKAYAKSPDRAVKKAVDQLMKRPAFGERWATLWLDLVRYADSGGLGQDQKRTIWAYRDWVVKAFNDDLPFDQFTLKQLAGDMLPKPTVDDLLATACHRNTQTNDEGGTDDEVFRVEAVVDRVNTTWQTWGSVTFGCAQCHDHPYDPLRNEEYYRFMAFYNDTADSDLRYDEPLLKIPENPRHYSQAKSIRAKILDLKEAVWQKGVALRDDTEWTGLKGLSVTANNSTEYAIIQKAEHDEFHTVGTVETKTHTYIDIPFSSLSGDPVSAIRLTAIPWDPETAVHSPEWGFLIDDLKANIITADGKERAIRFKTSLPDVAWMPTEPIKPIASNGKDWGADSRIHYPRQLVLVPDQALKLEPNESISIKIICNKAGHGSHPMAIQRGNVAVTSDPRWGQFERSGSKELRQKERYEEFIAELDEIPGTTVPIMQNRPKSLSRPTHIFERGNAMDKGDEVFAGLPTSLTDVAPSIDSPDRLAMAQWWVSDDHPLTARVFVNRLWEQLFGIGIVPTLEDFGSSGEKPTHPELLDYLAIQFKNDYKWSVKKILREIVLSHAFRQSSQITPEVLEKDPSNQFLARGPRIRLTAEMIRDQALAVSGLLSSKLGGEPVHPPLPEGVWRPFLKNDKWITPEVGDEDRYRRSLYTYTKRSIPYPSFASFDAPSREFCTPRRLTSNTPLQALVTLNDQTFVECAEALGKKLSTNSKEKPAEKLAKAYRLVTGRHANPDQIAALANLYDESRLKSPEDAWTIVAQVLLNLDETLTF